jgi:hypothetical protein
LRLLFNILFIGATSVAFGQSTADSVKIDSVRNRYLPTGIRIGTDLLALVRSQVKDDFKGWEVNADVDFYRYHLAVDYGSWGRTYRSDSADYDNDGRYWRIGADANFLLKDPDRNIFFIGLRYGRASFSEIMTIRSNDPIWGSINQRYENPAVTSRWLELAAGIKVKIYKIIWLGYTARFKFGLKNKGESEMLVHDIPGYGRTNKETTWGFNYQVFINIPVRKQPKGPLK